MAKLLKGKPVADAIKEDLKVQVEEIKAKGFAPKLAIIRVGERPDDLFYEGGAKKTCAGLGIEAEVYAYPADIDDADFQAEVKKINGDKNVNGILMFSPLPQTLNEKEIRALISPEKDVDSLTEANAGKVFSGDPTGFPPCTVQAVMEIIKFYDIPLKGTKITQVGWGAVVGKPLSVLLMEAFATVTVTHIFTKDVATPCKDAEVIISAAGKANLVNKNHIAPGQIIIDVGINQDPNDDSKIVGDVDFDYAEPIVDAITPVPGGVGSVTTAVLAKHTVKACMQQNGLL